MINNFNDDHGDIQNMGRCPTFEQLVFVYGSNMIKPDLRYFEIASNSVATAFWSCVMLHVGFYSLFTPLYLNHSPWVLTHSRHSHLKHHKLGV
jgi:hypothetical protein